jgi:hypothetical protein
MNQRRIALLGQVAEHDDGSAADEDNEELSLPQEQHPAF